MIFNRYWISDSSGLGVGKWQYFTGDFASFDDDELRHYILEEYESWVYYSDSYSFEVERNVKPTKEFLLEKLRSLMDSKSHIERSIVEVQIHILELQNEQE